MQTNFIELLSATAPAGLEQVTAALCEEVKGLLNARTPKRYLALEPYARDTNLRLYLFTTRAVRRSEPILRNGESG